MPGKIIICIKSLKDTRKIFEANMTTFPKLNIKL